MSIDPISFTKTYDTSTANSVAAPAGPKAADKLNKDIIDYKASPSDATRSAEINDAGQYLRYMQDTHATVEQMNEFMNDMKGILSSQGISAETASAEIVAASSASVTSSAASEWKGTQAGSFLEGGVSPGMIKGLLDWVEQQKHHT